jgi:hypothetical protein
MRPEAWASRGAGSSGFPHGRLDQEAHLEVRAGWNFWTAMRLARPPSFTWEGFDQET